MSRLDYITIFIVGICLVLLLYFLVKIANLDKIDPQPTPAIPSEAIVENSPAVDTTAIDTTRPEPLLVDTPQAPIQEQNEVVSENPTPKTEEFMVVAASFNTKALAEEEQKRIIRLGYEDAEIGFFNGGQQAAVITGRFPTYAAAQALAEQMKQDHRIDAYVHKKRLR